MSIKVNAVGVNSEFYDGNPLSMKAGETRYIQLELQNMVGNEDIYLKGVITQGTEFVTITDKDTLYFIPFGRKDIKVNLKVTIPENTAHGTYKFIASFVTATPGETTGTIRVGTGIDKVVPIRVNAPPQPVTGKALNPLANNNLTIVFIIAIIAIIVFLVLKKKKKK